MEVILEDPDTPEPSIDDPNQKISQKEGGEVKEESEPISRKSSKEKVTIDPVPSSNSSRKKSVGSKNPDSKDPSGGGDSGPPSRKLGVFGTPPTTTQLPQSILHHPGERKVSPGDRKISIDENNIRKVSKEDNNNRKISIEDSAHRKISIEEPNNDRKVSHDENNRKISIIATPAHDRKQSMAGGGRRFSTRSGLDSRRMSRMSTASGQQRKIGVLKRTLTQMTLSHLEIGSLKDGSIFEDFVPKKAPQILAALAATIGAIGMGTVMGYTSTANLQIEGNKDLGSPNSADISWVSSLVPMAAIFAGAPTGQSIDRIGRKTTMILLSLPFVLGWLLIAYAVNIPMMLVGRFLTGFCAGAFSLTAPVFISETAEDSIRGTLGSGFQLMVTIGILFSYVVGAFVSYVWLAIISASIPVVMVCLMAYVPASPRWLAGRGQMEEASKALAWFRGAESSQQVEDELKIIQDSIDESKLKKVKTMDWFSPQMLKPMSISVGLMFFQSLSGTDAVTFYTGQIFKDAGSSLDEKVGTMIVGAVQVLATFMSLILVDRAGRRVLLLASDAVMALALAALASFFFLDEEKKADFGMLPLVSLVVFVAAYSIGFGPVPWMMMGEILPNHVIGIASAIATSFNWLFTFLVIRFFDDLQKAIGPNWAYLFFCGWCCVGLVFVFFFVPETRGKSLDEIQELFAPKKPNSLPSMSPPRSRRVSRTTVDSLFFA